MLLEMAQGGFGWAPLPRWLVDEYAGKVAVVPVRLGKSGIAKQIFLGMREGDGRVDYLQAFIDIARRSDVIALPAAG